MGTICTANEIQKMTLECPHRKKLKKGDKPLPIGQNIAEPPICPMCQHIKQIKENNTSAELSELREHLSLATQNQDDETDSTPIKRSHKPGKKSINDFQVVRGLGKGAFGRVYMIKQRDSQIPFTNEQDILSLKNEDFEIQQAEQPQDIEFEINLATKSNQETRGSKMSLSAIKSSKIELVQDQAKTPNRSLIKKTSAKVFPNTPKYYALKIINKHAITSNKEKKQAMSQRYILEAMDHPFIVKLHYAFQTKSRLFLIVDLLPGGELFYLLRKMRKFSQTITRFYAAEILLAIEYLHQRSIIYRDLKPENILLDTQGHVKVTDFGLSKVMYSSNQKTYSLCGTPEYMAPQVIMGKGYTQAADWFSFGSLIYDMLTGRPPFLNNNKSTMLRNLCTKPVPLPYYLSQNAKSLLSALFQIDPQRRLGFRQGASQIKKHVFFKDINFDLLEKRQIEPPISFEDQMKDFVSNKDKCEMFVNNSGFEKWNSWHMNMQSPEVKKTKESKQNFQGFTFEPEEYEFEYQQEKQAKQQIPPLQ